MASRVNTSASAGNFINYYLVGLALKSRTLKRYLKKKKITQRTFAKVLGLTRFELRIRLYKRQKFNYSEITSLVNFLGAKVAIQIVWFPTIEEKRRVKKCVYEGEMKPTYSTITYHFGETPSEEKRRRIEEQNKESGEDWEQREDFKDYIFYIDELPSRRFMRRRKNGQW